MPHIIFLLQYLIARLLQLFNIFMNACHSIFFPISEMHGMAIATQGKAASKQISQVSNYNQSSVTRW